MHWLIFQRCFRVVVVRTWEHFLPCQWEASWGSGRLVPWWSQLLSLSHVAASPRSIFEFQLPCREAKWKRRRHEQLGIALRHWMTGPGISWAFLWWFANNCFVDCQKFLAPMQKCAKLIPVVEHWERWRIGIRVEGFQAIGCFHRHRWDFVSLQRPLRRFYASNVVSCLVAKASKFVVSVGLVHPPRA